MKRGFTVFELLVAIVILLILAAISYPLIVKAKNSAYRARCVSNLKQLGMALAMYRESAGGVDWGLPWEMGLPPSPFEFSVFLGPGLRLVEVCKGNNPGSSSYILFWPMRDAREFELEEWLHFVSLVGERIVVLQDENHQISFPRSRTWQRWTVIGVQLDGAVIIRTKLGFPWNHHWWHGDE